MNEKWRRLALGLFLFGVVGVATELALLGHYEDRRQWTPLLLLAAGLFSGSWVLARPSPRALRTLQVVVLAFIGSALFGIYFHIKANVEFELELRPSMAGMELAMETLRGAMPALAPGAMAQLGLLGLLATWNHPRLRGIGPRKGQPTPDARTEARE